MSDHNNYTKYSYFSGAFLPGHRKYDLNTAHVKKQLITICLGLSIHFSLARPDYIRPVKFPNIAQNYALDVVFWLL
jgi:hypothetical protein